MGSLEDLTARFSNKHRVLPHGLPHGKAVATQVERALVIDDNADVAEGLSWILEGLAHEIEIALSGQAAIELVVFFRPQLILCDIGMPRMDGFETCRHLRQMTGLSATIIAAVSGFGEDDDRLRAQEAGFDCHLTKPIHRKTLEELVRLAATADAHARALLS